MWKGTFAHLCKFGKSRGMDPFLCARAAPLPKLYPEPVQVSMLAGIVQEGVNGVVAFTVIG